MKTCTNKLESINVTHCSSNQQEQTTTAWPWHEERGRVNTESCDKVKYEEKRPRGRSILRWLDHIDCHLKGNTISLKELLGTKCLENREDWRKLISRPTNNCSFFNHTNISSGIIRPHARTIVASVFLPALMSGRARFHLLP